MVHPRGMPRTCSRSKKILRRHHQSQERTHHHRITLHSRHRQQLGQGSTAMHQEKDHTETRGRESGAVRQIHATSSKALEISVTNGRPDPEQPRQGGLGAVKHHNTTKEGSGEALPPAGDSEMRNLKCHQHTAHHREEGFRFNLSQQIAVVRSSRATRPIAPPPDQERRFLIRRRETNSVSTSVAKPTCSDSWGHTTTVNIIRVPAEESSVFGSTIGQNEHQQAKAHARAV
jgi:hypothetical protein